MFIECDNDSKIIKYLAENFLLENLVPVKY